MEMQCQNHVGILSLVPIFRGNDLFFVGTSVFIAGPGDLPQGHVMFPGVSTLEATGGGKYGGKFNLGLRLSPYLFDGLVCESLRPSEANS